MRIVGDVRERNEADVEERGQLVEQCPRHPVDVRAPREHVGDAADALELPGRVGSARVLLAAPTKDRRQEHQRGRGAAERANGR